MFQQQKDVLEKRTIERALIFGRDLEEIHLKLTRKIIFT